VTVMSGDSLSSIATKTGTTYIRLFDANSGITNPDQIYAGEVVVIPTATEQLPDRYGQFESTQTAIQSSPPAAPVAASQPTNLSQVTTIPNNSAWTELAACESGGNWATNTGNGFYGGLQFTLSSWQAMGGTGLPSDASEAQQIAIAQKLQSDQGWGAWPVCSMKLGL
jgi:hypothetical protein